MATKTKSYGVDAKCSEVLGYFHGVPPGRNGTEETAVLGPCPKLECTRQWRYKKKRGDPIGAAAFHDSMNPSAR
jgi:hypothetical protein